MLKMCGDPTCDEKMKRCDVTSHFSVNLLYCFLLILNVRSEFRTSEYDIAILIFINILCTSFASTFVIILNVLFAINDDSVFTLFSNLFLCCRQLGLYGYDEGGSVILHSLIILISVCKNVTNVIITVIIAPICSVLVRSR